jgi:hypothetical protein
MLAYEYRGYNGHKPNKPDPIEEILAIALYRTAYSHFMDVLQFTVKDPYKEYTGEDDLFQSNGKINVKGNLTKHLKDIYDDACKHVTSVYKCADPVHLLIDKFVILPDLSFAAVLKDGTVMVEIDKE